MRNNRTPSYINFYSTPLIVMAVVVVVVVVVVGTPQIGNALLLSLQKYYFTLYFSHTLPHTVYLPYNPPLVLTFVLGIRRIDS